MTARCGDGGVGMCPDDDVVTAARLALGVKGRMPDNKARAALKSLPGAKVVRDNNNKEEQSNDNGEDGFVLTQDKDTMDNETSHQSPQLGRTRQTPTTALASMT
jgi:hypothetical protein